MCGKNYEKYTICTDKCWRTENSFQNTNLVEVRVDDKIDLLFDGIFNDGENVPMKVDNLSVLPSWFDINKFKRGQRYFYNNYHSMFVSKLCGLLLVLSVPSILNVLLMTGKSSTPAKAFRRYMDTISVMLDWYNGDLNKKDSNIYKVLVSVRSKHCAAAKKAVTNGSCFISQKDLVLTQFGFMGLAVLKRTYLGIVGSTEDIEGFIHFWRTIGYLIGIEDRFNICNGNVNQVTGICEKLADNIFKPLMKNPCNDFIRMSDALLLGLKPVVPFQDKDAFMEFTRRMLGLPEINLSRSYARLLLLLTIYIHTTLLAVWWLAVIIRPILNVLLRFSVYANQKMPIVAIMMMGKQILKDQE